MLRSVNANFNAGNGWNLNANPVENPNRWNDGNQVVSRNCCILFLQASHPAAKHFADIVEFQRKVGVMLGVYGADFPKNL